MSSMTLDSTLPLQHGWVPKRQLPDVFGFHRSTPSAVNGRLAMPDHGLGLVWEWAFGPWVLLAVGPES